MSKGKWQVSIRADVKRLFEGRPNEKVWIHDLQQATGYTDKQLRQTVADIIRTEQLEGLEVAERANAWVYVNGEAENSKIPQGFTLVGETKKGVMILEDKNERLWVAKPLDG